jgi:hypothetical protein
MKKLLTGILVGLFFLIATGASAQFRKIPAAVTDSFKVRYPSAQGVSWGDKITSFQATFKLDTSEYTAKYSIKGEWQGSEKKIGFDALPAAVKDGLNKSKYADWNKGTNIMRYLPGNQIQYNLSVNKGDFQRRTLVFNPDGRMLKD